MGDVSKLTLQTFGPCFQLSLLTHSKLNLATDKTLISYNFMRLICGHQSEMDETLSAMSDYEYTFEPLQIQ